MKEKANGFRVIIIGFVKILTKIMIQKLSCGLDSWRELDEQLLKPAKRGPRIVAFPMVKDSFYYYLCFGKLIGYTFF